MAATFTSGYPPGSGGTNPLQYQSFPLNPQPGICFSYRRYGRCDRIDRGMPCHFQHYTEENLRNKNMNPHMQPMHQMQLSTHQAQPLQQVQHHQSFQSMAPVSAIGQGTAVPLLGIIGQGGQFSIVAPASMNLMGGQMPGQIGVIGGQIKSVPLMSIAPPGSHPQVTEEKRPWYDAPHNPNTGNFQQRYREPHSFQYGHNSPAPLPSPSSQYSGYNNQNTSPSLNKEHMHSNPAFSYQGQNRIPTGPRNPQLKPRNFYNDRYSQYPRENRFRNTRFSPDNAPPRTQEDLIDLGSETPAISAEKSQPSLLDMPVLSLEDETNAAPPRTSPPNGSSSIDDIRELMPAYIVPEVENLKGSGSSQEDLKQLTHQGTEPVSASSADKPVIKSNDSMDIAGIAVCQQYPLNNSSTTGEDARSASQVQPPKPVIQSSTDLMDIAGIQQYPLNQCPTTVEDVQKASELQPPRVLDTQATHKEDVECLIEFPVEENGSSKSSINDLQENDNGILDKELQTTRTSQPSIQRDAPDLDSLVLSPALFYSPPSSPIPTTRVPHPFGSAPKSTKCPAELAFDEFIRKSMCVSNISFERLYQDDTKKSVVSSSTSGASSTPVTSNTPVPSHTLAKLTTSTASSTSPALNAVGAESMVALEGSTEKQTTPNPQEESLLGPRPVPKKKYQTSRAPSPDNFQQAQNSEGPKPLVRIPRRHVFDMAYCWNCWSSKHKAMDCPDPHRTMDEREELRIKKRVIAKSWARELEQYGRKPAVIPIAGMSDEEACKLQTAAPLRNRKMIMRNVSPEVSESKYETAPGTDDWWNTTPPMPEISDAEVAEWANITVPPSPPQGTCFDLPWSDVSTESGTETSTSAESDEAHMDGDIFHSSFDSRSDDDTEVDSDLEEDPTEVKSTSQFDNLEETEQLSSTDVDMIASQPDNLEETEQLSSTDVDMTASQPDNLENTEQLPSTDVDMTASQPDNLEETEQLSSTDVDMTPSQPDNLEETEQLSSTDVDMTPSLVEDRSEISEVEDFSEEDGESHSIVQPLKPAIRQPRPDELLQEPKVIFVGSEALHATRFSRSPAPRNQIQHPESEYPNNLYLPLTSRPETYWRGRGTSRRYRQLELSPIYKLPYEIFNEIIQYIALSNLDIDPRDEITTFHRSRAESLRAYDLRHVRVVNRAFYRVAQDIIYSNVTFSAQYDLERFVRIIQSRERLANVVKAVTVDIVQVKLENWRNYGKPEALMKARETGKMTHATFNLLRDVWSIFESCKFLRSFNIHCTSAFQAYAKLEGDYPGLRHLSICDHKELGKSSEVLWENLRRFPNLEEISVIRPDDNRDLDFRRVKINPAGKNWVKRTYENLQSLKFRYSADISDKILLNILPNLPRLSRLHLYECKLVTSTGIARVLSQMKDRLTDFYYYDYVDCNGQVSADEAKTKWSTHLCPILAQCRKLQSLELATYKLCAGLFNKAHWEHLHTLRIVMMFYTGCHDEDNDEPVREALRLCHSEGRMPQLTNFYYQSNTPGLVYRKKPRIFTQEELERATGYIQ